MDPDQTQAFSATLSTKEDPEGVADTVDAEGADVLSIAEDAEDTNP